MVEAGLILMAVGMLVVFIFLVIMVILSNFASRIMLKYFPEDAEPLPVRRNIVTAASDDTELAIAIAAAHSPYRNIVAAASDDTELAIAIAAAYTL